MKQTHPISRILQLWPSRQDLAADMGLPLIVIHRWHQREGIPPKYDLQLLEAASRRNIPLLWRELMHARTVPKTKAQKALPDQDGHSGSELQEGNAA